MRNEILELGPCPSEENCAQVGDKNYHEKAAEECRRYIDLIRKLHGQEPEGARLYKKSFYHELGTYYEVVVSYCPDNKEAEEYAWKVEEDLPDTWDY